MLNLTATLVAGFLLCFAAAIASAKANILPEALQPGASGKDVVRNVNENLRRIFPDDHHFMDRLAYVESNYGMHRLTYRPGYNGGIYQVDEIGYRDTLAVSSHPGLRRRYQKITDEFGIDWPSTSYVDLRKPLYSGIAARLFLSNIPESIPWDKEAQGKYWKKYYNTESGAGDPKRWGGDGVAALIQRLVFAVSIVRTYVK